VVPSLGTSRYLRDCLESAASSEGVRTKILLVHPSAIQPPIESSPGLRLLPSAAESGFSRACNLGIAESDSEYVALLNDDAVVEPGWARHLIAALVEAPQAAAAQGVNLQMARPGRMDGRGLEWNRSWQAIQIGYGDPPPAIGGPIMEVFGVSATAAVYRRSALRTVAMADAEFFDVRLESYYEDVDLACRLRGAGYTALSVPAARALHAGATTTSRRPMRRLGLIHGNRYLVLARSQGRAFWPSLPRLLRRDLLDLGSAVLNVNYEKSVGIISGLLRAATHLRSFAHSGDPTVAIDGMQRRSEY